MPSIVLRSFAILLVSMFLPTALHAAPPGPDDTTPDDTTPDDGTASSPRGSNRLNPAISFNALLLGGWRRADTGSGATPADLAGPATGLRLQEAELILSAAVDPYFTADATVAFEDASAEGGHGFEVDLEEVFVTALRMPRGLGLRVGKMYLPFGRHNILHTHQFPFIQRPLVNERLLGDEGLNETAIEASYLLGLPWYSQIVGAVADGRNDTLFGDPRGQDLAVLGHFKNLWDLSEASTLELGLSALHGRRGALDDDSDRKRRDGDAMVYGGNATWRYRPPRRAIYRAFELQGELMRRRLDPAAGPRQERTGGYLHARWQLARRWWLQGRYDTVGGGDTFDGEAARSNTERRWSALVAFTPSEMSALRLEYATLDPVRGERDHQILAQLNFTIGSHPAHAY